MASIAKEVDGSILALANFAGSSTLNFNRRSFEANLNQFLDLDGSN
jgi:hypothetical protein